jgi:hypothetical protein
MAALELTITEALDAMNAARVKGKQPEPNVIQAIKRFDQTGRQPENIEKNELIQKLLKEFEEKGLMLSISTDQLQTMDPKELMTLYLYRDRPEDCFNLISVGAVAIGASNEFPIDSPQACLEHLRNNPVYQPEKQLEKNLQPTEDKQLMLGQPGHVNAGISAPGATFSSVIPKSTIRELADDQDNSPFKMKPSPFNQSGGE